MKLILSMALVAGLTITNAFARSEANPCLITTQADCVIVDDSKKCDHIKVYNSDPIVDYAVAEHMKDQVKLSLFYFLSADPS